MNRFSALLLTAMPVMSAVAQDATKVIRESAPLSAADSTGKIWTRGATLNVNITQVSLTNWSAGGNNSLGGIVLFNGFANRHKGKHVWDNSLIMAFGGQLQSQQGYSLTDDQAVVLKTDDRIELNSKWGRELKKPWYLSALGQFKTQFTEGFDANNTRISNLFAPAYLILAVGVDYRPNDNFSVFISPAAMKLTVVNDKSLYGGSTDPDLRVFGVKNGSTTEVEVGGYLRATYTKEIAKNFTFLTRGDLYSNYLRNPQNIDVSWETLWTLKVNSWFGASLNTLLLYDHDIDVPRLKSVDVGGVTTKVVDPGPGTQFKQTLGIGLTFKL
ncbi:MAG: DUF3078 domain-containing protein [Flavobacteriales bacterium]|nr:DUF3078 domain-containing protein [Flavobacteriales bacterium]